MAAGLLFFLVIAIALLTTDDETTEKTSAQPETQEKEPVEETEEETIDLTEKYASFAKSFVPKWTDETLELSDMSYGYIHEHYTLFPAFEKTDIPKVKKMEDTSVSVKMLNKNVTPYYKKSYRLKGVSSQSKRCRLKRVKTQYRCCMSSTMREIPIKCFCLKDLGIF